MKWLLTRGNSPSMAAASARTRMPLSLRRSQILTKASSTNRTSTELSCFRAVMLGEGGGGGEIGEWGVGRGERGGRGSSREPVRVLQT